MIVLDEQLLGRGLEQVGASLRQVENKSRTGQKQTEDKSETTDPYP
jgi:hypothetical protein